MLLHYRRKYFITKQAAPGGDSLLYIIIFKEIIPGTLSAHCCNALSAGAL
jgi:hypothetical protein